MSGNTKPFDLLHKSVTLAKIKTWRHIIQDIYDIHHELDWWAVLTPLYNAVEVERTNRVTTKNPPKRVKDEGH